MGVGFGADEDSPWRLYDPLRARPPTIVAVRTSFAGIAIVRGMLEARRE